MNIISFYLIATNTLTIYTKVPFWYLPYIDHVCLASSPIQEDLGPSCRNTVYRSYNLTIRLPEGTCGMLTARSGMASKMGIAVGGGIIDADYTREVKVLLRNHSQVDCS